tara:strand:- start:349 stop:489 length:141 start_codon:yes stop_codon:yes gene_type:complete
MDGKYFYEFARDNNPHILGSCIIEYVEKLKTDNDKLTKILKINETL